MTERRAPPDLSVGNRLMAEPYQVRRRVIELLDEMSAPMHPREIEQALLATGKFTRTERRKIVMALKHLPILAMGAGLP